MARSGTTWRAGESGNPMGRPRKGECVTACLRTLLGKAIRTTGGGTTTAAEALASVLLRRALGGDLRALHEILDRLEGRPFTRIEISEPEELVIIKLPLAPPDHDSSEALSEEVDGDFET
ncbi:MAG: DUF5681 domain-containing protein [Planctomycetota bacterium]|nr:DUF5681 domain-containing protein [Planctomycetota bacterium]